GFKRDQCQRTPCGLVGSRPPEFELGKNLQEVGHIGFICVHRRHPPGDLCGHIHHWLGTSHEASRPFAAVLLCEPSDGSSRYPVNPPDAPATWSSGAMLASEFPSRSAGSDEICCPPPDPLTCAWTLSC